MPRSEMKAGNEIMVINPLAILVVTYSYNIIKRSIAEIKNGFKV